MSVADVVFLLYILVYLDCLCRILQIGKYQYLSAVGILERYRLYISVQTGGVDAHRTGIHKLADMAQGVIVNIIWCFRKAIF